MGAEVGATTSTFPYTPNMRAYLNATARGPVARAADKAASQGFLSADEGAEYDDIINIVSAWICTHQRNNKFMASTYIPAESIGSRAYY
jgi:hypothetical protein